MGCPNEDKFEKNGICCDRCPAGQHVVEDCTATEKTKCEDCRHGRFTTGKNSVPKCFKCSACSRDNHKEKVKDCTAKTDTVCGCILGYYCSNENCEHCQPVKRCDKGLGVEIKATRTNNTSCAPCREGTYSNVTDFSSPCQEHIRCEVFGRELLTPGTPTTDAICGDFKTYCPWIIPTGLWSGFLLTVLIVFCLVCWRAKRRSFRAVKSSPSVHVTLLDVVPAAPIGPLELPLKSTELNDICQESYPLKDCKLSLFNPDDNEICCSTQDSMDSSFPITPLKASVSFVETKQTNGSPGHCTGFFRTHSEPQEDEWCGT
ncbi:tumor necrosis factor receptor superfamily member 5 [Scomber japonicus]|uniref:tumor necrosis factor receptor superfamily member 5 n=1 Tax=Scomber japonicus TaxID=13676 RepID=UPI002304DC75|nr:tumor necrosis factor receptor superfamily member 5 [Scomber japonicus]